MLFSAQKCYLCWKVLFFAQKCYLLLRAFFSAQKCYFLLRTFFSAQNFFGSRCSDATSPHVVQDLWMVKLRPGDAGFRTPGLSHAKRALYHWATSPWSSPKKFKFDLSWVLVCYHGSFNNNLNKSSSWLWFWINLNFATKAMQNPARRIWTADLRITMYF